MGVLLVLMELLVLLPLDHSFLKTSLSLRFSWAIWDLSIHLILILFRSLYQSLPIKQAITTYLKLVDISNFPAYIQNSRLYL